MTGEPQRAVSPRARQTPSIAADAARHFSIRWMTIGRKNCFFVAARRHPASLNAPVTCACLKSVQVRVFFSNFFFAPKNAGAMAFALCEVG